MVLGSHMTEEQCARNSVAHMNQSAETRAKISAAQTGRVMSPETRAKMSTSHMGLTASPETRAKISVANTNPSPEICAKIAAASMGRIMSPETRAKISGPSSTHWKGGKPVSSRKRTAKRRSLGYVYLNVPFSDCEGHHVDKEQVIHMPQKLHRSIQHNQFTGQGMAEINALAYEWLAKERSNDRNNG